MRGLGERIRCAREVKGVRALDLAREVGVSQSAVSQWESGGKVPLVEHLVVIARYLNVSTDYLLGTGECTCVVDCAEHPPTACSLSGRLHVHPRTELGTFGPCPVHPDAPGDL